VKKHFWLILGIVGLIALVVASYFLATGMIGSIMAYRSRLQHTPPTAGEPLGEPVVNRVVIVLVDALRVDTSLDSSTMPFLNELRGQGASAVIHSQPPSFSEPGYTTILTGAWPDINDGPAINLDYEEIPTFTQDDIFSAAHRAGLRTAITGYYWFEKLVPQAAVSDHFYTKGEDAAADVDVMLPVKQMFASGDQLVLIHLDQVDYAGHHLGGPLQPAWTQAARQADDYIREVAGELDFSQDTLIVISDHGQIDHGGHGGPEPVTLVEPFVMVGAAVIPGTYPDIHQVDIAPTISALLGLNIPASSQGTAQTGMLTLTDEYKAKILSAELAQKKSLFQVYTTAINSQPSSQPSGSDSASYVDAMASARSNRLGRERIWRVLVSVVLALIPLVVLIVRKEKKALWLAAAALFYVLVFNLRYAVIDGHTYSLSSVQSQMWLITYIGSTAAISLLLAWLAAMFILRGFKDSAANAARTSLAVIYFIIYILLLPVLVSFAVNGLLVGWTLPEFYTIFVAVMSSIQWLFIAAVGLLLTGIAALAARFIPRRILAS
jgi:hypothetical protein